MLTNAVAGGVLVAAYLVVLVLQLNPQIPIVSVTTWRWLRVIVALYGLYLTVGVMVVLVIREAFALRRLNPAWLSVRLLAWLSAAGAVAASILMWSNLKGFAAVLGAGPAQAMRHGAIAITIFASMLVLIAVARYSFGRRGSPATSVLLVATWIGSVIVPLGVRGPGDLPVPSPARPIIYGYEGLAAPHIRVLLLDGASLGYVRRRVALGQLPNFGLLLDHGAVMDVATLKPTEAAPIWTAAVTGKYPPKNGVRSDAIYRVGADDDDPVNLLPDYCFARSLVLQSFVRADRQELTSASLRARPIWDIGADFRVAPGVVNVPLTRPSHVLWGFLVSDGFDEAATSPLRMKDAEAADPTTAAATARDVFDEWQSRPWTDAVPGTPAGEPPPAGVPTAALREALWDHAYAEAADLLEQEFSPKLSIVRYSGLNALGSWFLEEAEPELFGQVPTASSGRSVLDRYYNYIDSEIGRALAKPTSPNDLLIVMSGFGMSPVSWPKREVARLLGLSDPSGGHDAAPDGFLLAYGGNVAHGQFPRGAIVDLAPTLLYYLRLPVGLDMDGFARTDLFLASYTADHPVTYIATHEK